MVKRIQKMSKDVKICQNGQIEDCFSLSLNWVGCRCDLTSLQGRELHSLADAQLSIQ
jgi:hypothetical protein